jgi:hypothetical protein
MVQGLYVGYKPLFSGWTWFWFVLQWGECWLSEKNATVGNQTSDQYIEHMNLDIHFSTT